MSMLNNLKKTKKNPVFLDSDDEDFDIDNMDFPLPSEGPSTAGPSQGGMPDMAQLQKMMQGLSGGDAHRPASIPTRERNVPAVATGPQGVRQMNPEDYKDWVCVYPLYIDADKSVQEGRRISREKCVKNPHAYHMAIAAQKLGFSVVYEGKRHPADWANVGRVRVQLKNMVKSPINQKISSRKQLFAAIAQLLPAIQKETTVPKSIMSPLTTLTEIEAMADEQRRAQGLPPLSEMQPSAPQTPPAPVKPKKQKIKYVRG
ncbi:signal recognition particle, SRP19 subunit [Pilobolus umbonatus]|nr:signal recognition particle, SRP19 subunit [Pilobolus umbonatus]